jgi:hypothetical protein
MPTVIEPIPHADDTDVAEQARPVDDDIEEGDASPEPLGHNWNAGVADLLDQRLSVSCRDDDDPLAVGHAAAESVRHR